MKKITRTIAGLLLATQLQAQDTTCAMVKIHEASVFIEVKAEEVLRLHLYDEKHRVRKVINTYPNGDIMNFALDSKNNIYFTTGPVKIEVRKPRLFILR